MRRAAIICAAVLAVAASPVALGVIPMPHLATVTPKSGHLMLAFTSGDLQPAEVQVASTATTTTSGAFTRTSVRMQERLTMASEPGVVHWRTRAALPAGTYYVHVAAVLTDGVTSCVHASNCLVRWSNVVKVQVPK